jgi:hypothetical protein
MMLPDSEGCCDLDWLLALFPSPWLRAASIFLSYESMAETN